ncbi:hypothetical protein [Streptomyces sp. NPDC048606]|uniref:hypothetical protein n=1 Tax=Streptomyces sp. NPDC048606 TaxID=3154726 RepID=UPI003413C3FC
MNQHVSATARRTPASRTAAPDRVRALVRALRQDIEAARWTPTPLEQRLCELLLTASAGDGTLTAPRVRAALAEGTMTLIHENDGRLAGLLGSLLPLLTGPGTDPATAGAVDEAHALLDRITRPAALHAARAGG